MQKGKTAKEPKMPEYIGTDSSRMANEIAKRDITNTEKNE